MGYFPAFGSVVFLLIHSISDVCPITPRRDVEDHVRISRTQVDEPPLADWEIGLREAAHQALLREGYKDPSLRDYLQSAPFSGKQTVKVFGDIAILARGQLYGTPVGYSFVQDPYHNDCDGCHNERKECRGDNCDHYVPYGAQQLVALWTVKRIRHRDINFGYRYEVEYTISPVDKALREGFLTINGRFDYTIPGHVFVIKSNPRYTNGYEHNEYYSSPDQVKWHRQYIPRPQHDLLYPNVLITHAHGPPITNINHNHPSISNNNPNHPATTNINHRRPPVGVPDDSIQHNNLKEIQLYRNLINSLSAKTSTTGHRFKVTTQHTTPRTTIDRLVPPATPTRNAFTTSSTSGRTTLVQLPTGQIVPLTEVATSTIPEGQLQILPPVGVGTLQTVPIPTDKVHFVPSSPITVTEVTKFTQANIPNQIPSTKIPIFIMKELIPPSSPSVKPEVVKDMGSTKLPKKTTIHFFAAEDIDKSVQEEKDINDIFTVNTKKYPTRKQFTKPSPPKTTDNYYEEDEDDINLFPAAKPTEAMRRVTEAPFRDTSPTVNQISRPYKETVTTHSLPSTTSKAQNQQTSSRRTTNSYTTTTEIPFSYGTQRTTITLPIPSTLNQQTTKTTNGKEITQLQRTTVTQPMQTTSYQPVTRETTYGRQSTEPQRSTITQLMQTTLGQPTTGETTYSRQTTEIRRTTPMQRSTYRPSTFSYDFSGTPEPNETLITVTPVPTVPIGENKFEESTARTYEYTQGRLTTFTNNEYTTERREPVADNALSRTTLIFPSTAGSASTLSPLASDTAPRESTNYDRTTQTYSESSPTTEKKFKTPLINTIVTYFSPQTTEYNNVVYPLTETVPIQTTTRPIAKLTTAIFRSSTPTRLATTKLKPTTSKGTTSDFLVEEISDEDNSAPMSKNKSKYQDYTDDDIFGPSKTVSKGKKFSSYKQQPYKSYKTSFTTEPTRTVAKTPRVIYSDFYEASTVPPTTSLTQFYAESQNNYITQPMDSTTQRLPLTSQSYLTSISYKVNKKKPMVTDELEVLPTIKAKLSNLLNEEKLQIFRAELPEMEENHKKSEDKEAFDNIALQLVNHARGLEVLNEKPIVENKNPLQMKKNPKYKRRSYMPKSRKNLSEKAKNKKEQ